MTDLRPDPDQLLRELQDAEHAARRGKMKIFFGASAGVGKTYAMLLAAHEARRSGIDVVVGLVETHGRRETMALLDGLPVLPLQQIAYRERTLQEFDLDAALARKPALILVDELAHSNAPGSRHPRRWQDIEELLDAGIDVFTTMNVQHLESLNDVVGGITSVRVSETVPDTVFDQADEVVLVDLPPDELLRRLKQGKVYLPQQAERAAQSFFRKGNLIALRELALRRTANRVDADVRAWRHAESIQRVWETRDALLVCIGPRPGSEKIVRAAARLADRLNADWHAVYVETSHLQQLRETERQRILKVLALAQELGAHSATISGENVVVALLDYARGHNISRVVIGRAGRNRWWRQSVAQSLAQQAADLDVIQIARDDAEAPLGNRAWAVTAAGSARGEAIRPWGYLWALVSSAAAAGVAQLLFPYFELANIVMLFLLAVMVTAARFGRGPSALAAVVNVLVFDFFFVQPRFSFAVSDAQYLLTFAVMLAVGLITGQLTASLRYQLRVAEQRESRARALYEMARDLSGALTTEQVTEISNRSLASGFNAATALLVADLDGRLQLSAEPEAQRLAAVDIAMAQWAYDHAQPAGAGTDTLPSSARLYLPLKAPMRLRGVLAIQPTVPRWLMVPEQRRQLETFASLIAIALERVHYVDVARSALVQMESERLRNSLLSALSHDLRTPLTALVGLADSLVRTQPPLPDAAADMARSLHAESLRMSALVVNLLDMARLEAGAIQLRLEWQSLEEVVGSALAASRSLLGRHKVVTALAPDLPLVRFDAALLERVLCNLIENAVKYTPPDSTITIAAEPSGGSMRLTVADNGPGLPAGQINRLFDKFARGVTESAIPGVGLGLAICRAIVEAHGGTIEGVTNADGGASFVINLPSGQPPSVELEAAEMKS
ncbi:two-component system sensor histidine kinase KdpD [Actimicrobium sp. GrIS 1.19]|uniref:two-component system sensor histidine kinase KdpD n=1 Tax=Actimicrobium sp. GrIS 1.19 TaxID=3071708 RepID=UPI002DF787C4|nr:two-component system sensor histidine kinase KdpD [Actimicrobium sp. GrIS 1.19]